MIVNIIEESGNEGLIIVASGGQSRNRDYMTGKAIRLNPAGMRIDGFSKNGIVLWQHDDYLPVGRGNLRLHEGMLVSDKVEFHRMKIGQFDTGVIADLWEGGFLKATSVRLSLSPEDEANIVELEHEIFIPSGEVSEFSIVSIPADRDAVRQQLEQMQASTAMRQMFSEETYMQEDGVLPVAQAPIALESEQNDDAVSEIVLDASVIAEAISADATAVGVIAQAVLKSILSQPDVIRQALAIGNEPRPVRTVLRIVKSADAPAPPAPVEVAQAVAAAPPLPKRRLDPIVSLVRS